MISNTEGTSSIAVAAVMEDVPFFLRLKEVQVPAKVTEKVDRLTVFGGLDGAMKDMVCINVGADTQAPA